MLPLHIVCLFDKSGIMGQPWADAGHGVSCFDVDVKFERRNNVHYNQFDLRDWNKLIWFLDDAPPDLIIAFPPCTDLAVSGAKHFKKKQLANPRYLDEAMELFTTGERVADRHNIPCFTENPISRASTLHRKPEAIFQPYEYGGYLPENDIHPLYPEYIVARDAYPKKTCAWLLNGCELPPKKPVPVDPGYSLQFKKLGGKSKKTKDIRSITPRGFAKAFFLHMEPKLLKTN